ncbi:MAG: glycosyltransferase [Bacteroidales bacterium]|nr:glycosyltransferase [Bacteroidales bacterium]
MITLFLFKSNVKGIRYGIGTYIKQLTKSLSNYNYRIFVVDYFSNKNKEFSEITVSPSHKELLIPIPIRFEMNDKNSIIYGKRIVDCLVDYIDKNSTPIFIFNYSCSVFIARQLKARFSAPIISIVHLAEWQYPFMGNKQKLIQFWKIYKKGQVTEIKELDNERELFELSDRIVSVTSYMKDFLCSYYKIPPSKILVIQNGICSSDFQIYNKQTKDRLKKQLGFKSNEKIVLFTGRADLVKGLHFLIESFKKVTSKNKNVRLIIIGELAGFDKICQHLSQFEEICSKITFTGYLVYEKVLMFYQIADIGILPSIYDHCPYTALEMIGHNIPLIISNTEGLNEVLTDRQSVYLNPIYDSEGNISFDTNEIAEAILTLVNNKEKIKQITKDYKYLTRDKFSSKRMAEEMNNLFLTLADRFNMNPEYKKNERR